MVAHHSTSARVGLKINTGKTQEMRIQVTEGSPLRIGNEDIQTSQITSPNLAAE